MFKLKRKKRLDDKLTISPTLRKVIAAWLTDHGYSDPAEQMQRGWLVDLAIDLHVTTADRDALIAALQRTVIPAQFSISRLPLQLASYVVRLGHDGLLRDGGPLDPQNRG